MLPIVGEGEPTDLLVVKLDTAKLENWLPWTEDTALKPVHGIQFSELGTATDHHIFILNDRGEAGGGGGQKKKQPLPPKPNNAPTHPFTKWEKRISIFP